MKHLLIPMLLLSMIVIGCGGGAASTPAGTPQTLEDHKAAAAKMDKDALIAKANEMLKTIDGRMPEIAALAKEIAPLMAKTDEASKAKLAELQTKMADIQAERKAQAEVMNVYKAAAKTAGAACAPAGG